MSFMIFEPGPEKTISVSTERMFRDQRPWVVVTGGQRYVGSSFTADGPCEGFSPSPRSARLRTAAKLTLHDPVNLGVA